MLGWSGRLARDAFFTFFLRVPLDYLQRVDGECYYNGLDTVSAIVRTRRQGDGESLCAVTFYWRILNFLVVVSRF